MLAYLILILILLSFITKNPVLGGVFLAVYVIYKIWGFLRRFRSGDSSGGGFLSRWFFGSKSTKPSSALPADQLAVLLAAINPDKLEVKYPLRRLMPLGREDPLGGLFRE